MPSNGNPSMIESTRAREMRLVDGRRSVGEIAAELAQRGTGAEAFERGWRATFGALENLNRLLLAAPIG